MPDVFDLVNSAPQAPPSGDVFDLVNQPTERPSLPRRLGSAVKEMVTHPWETAKGIVTAPLHAAKTGAEFIGQTAAEMSLPDDVRGYALDDPERISEKDALIAAAQLAAIGPGGRLLSKIPKVGLPVAGVAAGAAFAPDDPAVGMILGGAGGAVAQGVPAAIRAARARMPAPAVQPKITPRIPASEAGARLAQTVKPQAVDAPVSTAAARDVIAQLEAVLEPNRVKPGEAAPMAAEVFPEGYSTPAPKVGRVPASEAEARLARAAKAQAEDAPVSTADARAAVAAVEDVLAANRVQPKGAFPATPETFPEGYTTKSTTVRRRPAGEAPPSGDVFDLVLEREPVAPPVEPVVAPKAAEPIPTIGEPVSFGRDLAEAPRIPADLPKTPRPRGVEPSGIVETPEGAVSAGPMRPKTTAEQMLEVGKQRAAELVKPDGAPDLMPAMKRTGQQLADPAAVPSPVNAPHEYLNYAKFGLDQTTEARLRSTVDQLRKTGDVEKGYKSFAEQQAEADAFAKQLVQNPLDIDRAKLSKLSGAEIVGLRTVAGENMKMMEGLSKAIESGELNVAELAEAQRMIDQTAASVNEVLGSVVRETAQSARDLGFLRQVAKLSTDPDVWVVRAKKIMGDKPLSDALMIEIRKLAREAAEACA
jgi:hypothetical protein